MADGLKVTSEAAGRRRAVSTAALLCGGAIVGVVAAMWLFDGSVIEGDRTVRPMPPAEEERIETDAAAEPAKSAAAVERVVTSVRRAQVHTEDAPSAPGQAGADEKEPEIKAGEYIAALRAAGETGGIAAFNPPGTDPLKEGIIVPDDYELPPGYARRYQVTDDGQQLPPILIFSPDYEFLDQNGNPIALPDDLIVPPEMAPPDLPLRTLNPKKYAGR